MGRHSSSLRAREVHKRKIALIDHELDKLVARSHKFTFFRVGKDLCAICKKTLREHKEASK